MIYVFLNLVMAVFFVGLAVYIDSQSKEDVTNPLVSMSVWMALATAFMAGTVWTNLNYLERMPLFFYRVSVICFAMYSVDFCLYCIHFPSYERKLPAKILRIAAGIFFTWVCFSKVEDLTITDFLGIRVDAVPLFSGRLTNYFPVTWADFLIGLSQYALPSLAVLIMILRAENKDDRLNMQKTIMSAIALVAFWFTSYAITKACGRVKMFSTLSLLPGGISLVILSYNSRQNFLYDIKYVVGGFITFTLCYLIPAVITGIFFPRLWPQFSKSPLIFFVQICLVILVCITISYQITKFLTKKQYFRSFQYAETLEESLSKMDYSGEPEEIVRSMQNILIHNLGLSEMHVLVESEGKLVSIFDQENQRHISVDTKNPALDALLSENRQIVLKSVIENSHTSESEKKNILKLFAETNSDAIILLTEGRRIIGALILGEKAGGNIYADYDFNTFTKFYSYFFVFGYYMKNIAHQSIVGTINREIRMSSQIIESIQENMDPVKNPHFDTGYIMEHAHNIGGEFVDLIRLTDKRHIFVLGDLSGKGISASMSMVIVKSIIRTYLEETRDFKLLVEKVNQFIRFNLPKGTFFEGIFGLIDFTDDTLYYINCGVPALFLYTRSYNNVIEIQGDGRVLGFVKDISRLIKVKKVKLNPGDIVVTCTDGLIDSKSLRGEIYGKERIQKSITEGTSFTASNLARSMYQTSLNFLSKGLDDDVSILVIKRLNK